MQEMSERGCEFLTVREVAKILGVSKSAVWRWIHKGKIRNAVKVIPGVYYIPAGEIQRLKDEMKKHEVKVFQTNEYSLAVRLPKKWCKKMGLGAGDMVLIFEDKDRLVVLPRQKGGGE